MLFIALKRPPQETIISLIAFDEKTIGRRRATIFSRDHAMAFIVVSSMMAGFVPTRSPLQPMQCNPALARTSVRMQDMWVPPKDLGPLPDLRGLFPSDVQFRDVDGEELTFRSNENGTVNYWVNGKGRMRSASIIVVSGSLHISGTIKKPVPLFTLIGFNHEDFVTDVATPKDFAVLKQAMALVGSAPREVV